ncbi:MAG TPA: hypothetical protein PK308_06745 [Phycisphaerales bacterium]|jgi:O-acetyl-ADP-ribose deacetylase (regulator of RNase III)|nr:hypothetical protein [Phycisphaerales bacterium]
MSTMLEKSFDENRFRKAIAKAAVKAEALGAKRIGFTCVSCGATNRVTVDQIARQAKVACAGCARPIALLDKGGGFGKAMRKS